MRHLIILPEDRGLWPANDDAHRLGAFDGFLAWACALLALGVTAAGVVSALVMAGAL